jgi:hypothetical protein
VDSAFPAVSPHGDNLGTASQDVLHEGAAVAVACSLHAFYLGPHPAKTEPFEEANFIFIPQN